MAEKSRIKFNPVTKEIEVEGSESFVKIYFGKLQAMISGTPKAATKEPKVKRGRPVKKAVKAAPIKKAKKRPKAVKAPRVKKAKKAATKAVKPATAKRVKKIGKRATVGKKRGALSKAVLGLINGSPEGISMAELKVKTGLKDIQIRNVLSDATKRGKIRTVKRGVYVGVSEYVDARLADAHDLVKKLKGPFDFVFCDADKEWYKNYFIELYSKFEKGGCYTAHNVSSSRGWSEGTAEFYDYIKKLPDIKTTVDESGGGISISYKQ